VLIVAGASGHLGRGVAEELLGRVRPEEVRLLTRTPERLDDLAVRGADVRRVDLDEPDTLPGALAGGRRLLLISTDALDRRVAQHRAAIDAAVRAGVGHVIYTSVVAPEPENPAAVVETHRRTEDDLRAAGCAWTLLRNNLYAEYQEPEARQAGESGRLVHNRGGGAAAYVARTDCAAAAAAVLAGDGHEGKAYDITGPESLSAPDLALLYGELAGRPVEPVAIDDDAFVAGMVGDSTDGHLAYGAQLVASFGRAIREGHFRRRQRRRGAPHGAAAADAARRAHRRVGRLRAAGRRAAPGPAAPRPGRRAPASRPARASPARAPRRRGPARPGRLARGRPGRGRRARPAWSRAACRCRPASPVW
jgi:NAD(P)H dehydrogenase (quinone)